LKLGVEMPRFYYDIQTRSGVEHDVSGVYVADSATALVDCVEVIIDVMGRAAFDDLQSIIVLDENHVVIASFSVDALRRVSGYDVPPKALDGD
jgi:hypothetical protein